MKQTFLSIILFAGLFTTRVNAQDSVVTLPSVTVRSHAMVAEQVDKSFRKTFPDAENLRWYKLNKDYLAKFILKDMDHQSLFKTNGYLVYDVSYGSQKDMPEEIRDQVINAYNLYKITRVAKVVRSNQSFWIINIEGLNNFIVLRAEDGEISEVSKISKTD